MNRASITAKPPSTCSITRSALPAATTNGAATTGQHRWWLQTRAKILGNPNFLTSFTLTSSNDSPERDPLAFSILGSNDGVNFETIFAYDNEFGNLFTARNQTLVF